MELELSADQRLLQETVRGFVEDRILPGSYGYSAEVGIERYVRNTRAPIIYAGTTQIHKMMQAEHALGYRRLNGSTGEMSPLVAWAPALSPVHARAGV